MYLRNWFFCIVWGGGTDITERRLSTSCQRYCRISKGLCVTCIFIACCCVIVLVSQGAHMTINARHEGNVEEKVVLEKVSKSSGARCGFHKEKARPVEPSGPVVCMLYLY